MELLAEPNIRHLLDSGAKIELSDFGLPENSIFSMIKRTRVGNPLLANVFISQKFYSRSLQPNKGTKRKMKEKK